MPKFRKKPVVIEAEQFLPDEKPLPFADRAACNLGPDGWYVVTIHGQETRIAPGDWIIPEPDGKHFYPCKPGIFEQTYEPAEGLLAPPSQQRAMANGHREAKGLRYAADLPYLD